MGGEPGNEAMNIILYLTWSSILSHPSIHCDGVHTFYSWTSEAQCPGDLSAVLCVKHQPTWYNGARRGSEGLTDIVGDIWGEGEIDFCCHSTEALRENGWPQICVVMTYPMLHLALCQYM